MDTDLSDSNALPALQQAWLEHGAALERIRAAFVTSPVMNLAKGQESGIYHCLTQAQAHAHNLMIAPDTDHPVFFFNSLFDPFVGYAWLLPNPDFFYRMAYLNGSGEYRIRVRPNDASWINIHVRNDMWGMGDVKYLGSFDLEEFTANADGWVEIVASAERQPGNWIPLDAGSTSNFLNVRAALLDWESGRPAEFYIDILEPPHKPVVKGAAEAARRIERATRFMEFSAIDYTLRVVERTLDEAGGVNRFAISTGAKMAGSGNSPRNIYVAAVFDLAADEALIVDIEKPSDARFWGVQLGDIWNQTLNYVEHQSCLNAQQSHIDADGRVRFVISQRDPGVPNWLDPIGHRTGNLMLRAHGSTSTVEPAVRKVHFNDVRRHLPPETPVVSESTRRQTVARRGQAIRRLYGY